MENSSNSWRKLIRFCVGGSILVLSGVFLDCKRPHPKLTITFTGTGDSTSSTQAPPADAPEDKGKLIIGNHDLLEWRNNSDTDTLVCMVETDLDGRAFAATFFYVPIGSSVFSGPVRPHAKSSNPSVYDHTFTWISDPSSSPVDDCGKPSVNGENKFPHKPIPIPLQ